MQWPTAMRRHALVVEEKSPRAAGFSLPVDFEVNVLENAGLRWRRAFLGKLGRCSRFRFDLRVDGFELFLGEDFFGHEPILEESNRIVLVLVFLNLLCLAIAALVLGISYRLSVLAIGVEFDNGGSRFFVSPLESLVRDRPHFVEVLPVSLFPFDPECLGALR